MEELTPELERRIQVEELWGRRVVLEDSMNAWRSREYQSRRLLSLLTDERVDESTFLRSTSHSVAAKAKSGRSSKPFIMRRVAVAAGLVLFTWLVAQHVGGKLSAAAFNPPAASANSYSNPDKPQPKARMSDAEQKLWTHPQDLHGPKVRPLDADLKKVFGSSL